MSTEQLRSSFVMRTIEEEERTVWFNSPRFTYDAFVLLHEENNDITHRDLFIIKWEILLQEKKTKKKKTQEVQYTHMDAQPHPGCVGVGLELHVKITNISKDTQQRAEHRIGREPPSAHK